MSGDFSDWRKWSEEDSNAVTQPSFKRRIELQWELLRFGDIEQNSETFNYNRNKLCREQRSWLQCFTPNSFVYFQPIRMFPVYVSSLLWGFSSFWLFSHQESMRDLIRLQTNQKEAFCRLQIPSVSRDDTYGRGSASRRASPPSEEPWQVLQDARPPSAPRPPHWEALIISSRQIITQTLLVKQKSIQQMHLLSGVTSSLKSTCWTADGKSVLFPFGKSSSALFLRELLWNQICGSKSTRSSLSSKQF